MENYHKITIFKFSMGKSTINGPFSIAMLNYQRVSITQLKRLQQKGNAFLRFVQICVCILFVSMGTCPVRILSLSHLYIYIYICHLYIYINISMGTIYLYHMVTWNPSIYSIYVSIFTSTMDPSWVRILSPSYEEWVSNISVSSRHSSTSLTRRLGTGTRLKRFFGVVTK